MLRQPKAPQNGKDALRVRLRHRQYRERADTTFRLSHSHAHLRSITATLGDQEDMQKYHTVRFPIQEPKEEN